jgi:hypothetical protein
MFVRHETAVPVISWAGTAQVHSRKLFLWTRDFDNDQLSNLVSKNMPLAGDEDESEGKC